MQFEKILSGTAKGLESMFQRTSAAKGPHQKGFPREEAVGNFFKEWLPNKYGVAISSNALIEKRLSQEIDSCP